MGRNMALKMSKGEYFMFVDSDDKITLDAVKQAGRIGAALMDKIVKSFPSL